MAVAKKIRPQMDAAREQINAENIPKKIKTRRINKIEDTLQKEATKMFSEILMGPHGKGLRVFFQSHRKKAIQTQESVLIGNSKC